MGARREHDVLVVGAGTAGTWFAWRLAREGFSVAVLDRDRRPDIGSRLDIFHLDSIRFAQFGVPEPHPRSEELVAVYPDGKAHSPSGKRTKLAEYGFHVMRLPLFLRRLHGLVEESGAQIMDGCVFREPLVEEGKLVGVRMERGGRVGELRSRLTVDASGVTAALRTSLPASLGVETFRPGPEDLLYVVLRYIRWKEPRALHPRGLNLWPFHKVFCNPSYSEEEAILGVGQPGSYERAEGALRDFLRAVPFPPFEVLKVERGVTPYCRSPLSLVGDGFLCLGDAACITKPFSGEGITSAWTLCAIAAEEVARALRRSAGPLTREELWGVNWRYFRGQGAEFAGMLAQLKGAMGLSADEMEYLFERDIIFNGRDITAVNRDYRLRLSPRESARVAGWLAWGLFTRRFSPGSLRSLLGSLAASERLARHYRAYPLQPGGFAEWRARAEALCLGFRGAWCRRRPARPGRTWR